MKTPTVKLLEKSIREKRIQIDRLNCQCIKSVIKKEYHKIELDKLTDDLIDYQNELNIILSRQKNN